jgi:hypothetical protein
MVKYPTNVAVGAPDCKQGFGKMGEDFVLLGYGTSPVLIEQVCHRQPRQTGNAFRLCEDGA